ncbi:alpha/beta fold hydrolase [Pseudomonas mangiferae]|uniref:Alpha/beta hydrolase n=1 Tax=Pseudomonas mangiferae TaxID=2593654 RepID=A0A553H492_9PSED|nr:alpha/beta hydrolase [Pseudomonas mangiferae]TRX76562.1 alpha/beta hydrolase [Pseudomonas mangiferae]
MGIAAGMGIVALAGVAILVLRRRTRRITREVEGACPAEGQFLDVEGVRLHYVEAGEGPTLLLVHGLSGNGRNFTHSLVPALTDRFRVVVLDRPGAGYSDPLADAETGLFSQAALVARFIQAKGLERPLVLGHSLGGGLALALALNHPQQVRGLVLVAPLTHPQPLPPTVFLPLAIRPALLRRWVADVFAAPVGMLGRRHALRQVFAPDPVPEDFAYRGGAVLAMRPGSFYSASCELERVNHDLTRMLDAYPRLALPIGLLYGTEDPILDCRRHGDALHRHVPGIVYEQVPGQGHMLPVTAVDRVVSLVERIESQTKA